MDLRAYYRKIREAEAVIGEEFPVVRSLATEEGGKDGHLTEVPRATAARMLTDGIVELAKPEETRAFRVRIKEARKREEERQKAAFSSLSSRRRTFGHCSALGERLARKDKRWLFSPTRTCLTFPI